MVWNILPTEQRVARIYNGNPNCKYCLDKRNMNEEGGIEHFLIQCPENLGISEKIMRIFEDFSNINPKKMITFSFKIQQNREYPMVWLLANFLTKLWDLKKSKKFSKNELRSQLLADNSLQKKILC